MRDIFVIVSASVACRLSNGLRFLDTANFVNSNTFLSQLNSVKKVRITTVSWYLKEVDFKFNINRISNTVH